MCNIIISEQDHAIFIEKYTMNRPKNNFDGDYPQNQKSQKNYLNIQIKTKCFHLVKLTNMWLTAHWSTPSVNKHKRNQNWLFSSLGNHKCVSFKRRNSLCTIWQGSWLCWLCEKHREWWILFSSAHCVLGPFHFIFKDKSFRISLP